MMEKWHWYTIHLKAWLLRKNSWYTLAVMVILLGCIACVHIPKRSEQMQVIGMYTANDQMAEKILQHCMEDSQVFRFVSYDSKMKLENDVMSGNIVGGCVFDDAFSKHIEDDNIRKQVTCLTASGSSEIFALKETIYAAFFEVYSSTFLGKQSIYVFDDTVDEAESEVNQTLTQNFEKYIAQDALFHVVYEEVSLGNDEDVYKDEEAYSDELTQDNADGYNDKPTQDNVNVNKDKSDDISEMKEVSGIYPLQGVSALFLFIMAWMCMGKKLEKTSMGLFGVLNRRSQMAYTTVQALAELTIPSVCALIIVLLSGQNSRGMLLECAWMLIFICICSVWTAFVGQLIHTVTAWSGWVLTLCLVQVLICPVFFNLSQYIPAVKYLKYLLPVGWYI